MNKLGNAYIFISTGITLIIVFLVTAILIINSFDSIVNLRSEIFTLEWNPAKNKYGILCMLFGTLAVTFLALLIAVPLGISAAVYLSEFVNKKYRLLIKSALEVLAGIPSIIYGLIGIAFFSPFIAQEFHVESGRTLLTGALVLSIMILPTIITLADDSFSNVPYTFREASKGLGLYPSEIIFKIILPLTKINTVQIILLALGRAIGETMAVMLLIGNKDKLPSPITNFLLPGQTITSKIGREITETTYGSLHFSSLILLALTLFVIVLVFISLSMRFAKSNQPIYE